MPYAEVSNKARKIARSKITNTPGRIGCKPGTGESRMFAHKTKTPPPPQPKKQKPKQ